MVYTFISLSWHKITETATEEFIYIANLYSDVPCPI